VILYNKIGNRVQKGNRERSEQKRQEVRIRLSPIPCNPFPVSPEEIPMALTVSQVSRLSHVSVRTLHHYDEIGLLRPSARSEAGYRLYSSRDVERLQQILFYRELELPLDEIQKILSDPGFDVLSALYTQRQLLEEKIMRLSAILGAVKQNIHQREGDNPMSEKDMFEVFGDFKPEQHEEEVKERWGDTDAYKESKRRASRYTKQDWLKIKAEAEAVTNQMAALLDKGIPANSVEAMSAAEEHRLHISKWFYPCSKEFHKNLGEMYIQDARFTATYEKIRAGLARYVHDAVVANSSRI
jgi:DNA-binding transcriptional MerR regulator